MTQETIVSSGPDLHVWTSSGEFLMGRGEGSQWDHYPVSRDDHPSMKGGPREQRKAKPLPGASIQLTLH